MKNVYSMVVYMMNMEMIHGVKWNQMAFIIREIGACVTIIVQEKWKYSKVNN